MLNWITNAVGNIASWLGDGVASFVSWILNGIGTLVTKIIDALNGIWDVLDAIWDFGTGFIGNISALLTTIFPFVPAAVTEVIIAAMTIVLVAGIYRMVRGK